MVWGNQAVIEYSSSNVSETLSLPSLTVIKSGCGTTFWRGEPGFRISSIALSARQQQKSKQAHEAKPHFSLVHARLLSSVVLIERYGPAVMFYVSREDSELTRENALEILPMGVFFDKICLPIHECRATNYNLLNRWDAQLGLPAQKWPPAVKQYSCHSINK